MGLSASEWIELFPDTDYGHRLRFRRGAIQAFFGRTSEAGSILSERRRWLATAPGAYAGARDGCVPLLRETVALAVSCGIPSAAETVPGEATEGDAAFDGFDGFDACVKLGALWEPDWMLLAPDGSKRFRLLGGCVCFPSSWEFAEKLGLPLDAIHDVVPGLNPALGARIQSGLHRLRPGHTWERANWGLSRFSDRNQHPTRGLRPVDGTEALGELWLRVERQALVALPLSRGVLFGIRIAVCRLDQLAENAVLRAGFRRALSTMPEPMARYKHIEAGRAKILEQIDALR